MDEDCIVVSNGDHFTVVKDDDGGRVIRIQNSVWVEEPRFIVFSVAGKHDRDQAITELIGALEQLRRQLA